MRDIQRDAQFDDLVKRLADQKHPKLNTSIFKTMRELLCFAALVGYERGVRQPLKTKSETPIPSRVFETNDLAMDLIYLIALSETKSSEVLKSENETEAITIFEEYASGGLSCINDWLSNTPTDAYGDVAIINALQELGLMEQSENDANEQITIEI